MLLLVLLFSEGSALVASTGGGDSANQASTNDCLASPAALIEHPGLPNDWASFRASATAPASAGVARRRFQMRH